MLYSNFRKEKFHQNLFSDCKELVKMPLEQRDQPLGNSKAEFRASWIHGATEGNCNLQRTDHSTELHDSTTDHCNIIHLQRFVVQSSPGIFHCPTADFCLLKEIWTLLKHQCLIESRLTSQFLLLLLRTPKLSPPPHLVIYLIQDSKCWQILKCILQFFSRM